MVPEAIGLRYPVGQFVLPDSTTAQERAAWIREIARAPSDLRAAVSGLSEEQLNTPYRPEGWTVRQVVHHVPESHMNSNCDSNSQSPKKSRPSSPTSKIAGPGWMMPTKLRSSSLLIYWKRFTDAGHGFCDRSRVQIFSARSAILN